MKIQKRQTSFLPKKRLGPIFSPNFFLRVVYPPKFSSQKRIHLGFNHPMPYFSCDNNLPLMIYPTH